MGIGDLFKRRRARESALAPGTLAELEAEAGAGRAATPGWGEPPEPDASPPAELPGADAGELGAMLRRAATTGMPQVSTESHSVDLEGGDLGREILGLLGGEPARGAEGVREIGPEELRELHQRVRDALRRQGIDPDRVDPAAFDPGTGEPGSGEPETGEPG